MTQEHTSAEHIERDIEHTRGDINRKLDELQERLSPGQWIDQALGFAKDGGGEFGRNLGRVVRENPVPVVLLCASAAWLATSATRKRSDTGSTDHSEVSNKASASHTASAGATKYSAANTDDEGSRIAGVGSAVKDKLGAAKEQGKTIASDVRERSGQAKQATQSFIQERPLTTLALGLAVGAAMGAAFPVSRREHEALGDKSDAAIRKAKEAASEQVEYAKEMAQDIASAAVQSAKAQAEEHGLPTGRSTGASTGTDSDITRENRGPGASSSTATTAGNQPSQGSPSSPSPSSPSTGERNPGNIHNENGLGSRPTSDPANR